MFGWKKREELVTLEQALEWRNTLMRRADALEAELFELKHPDGVVVPGYTWWDKYRVTQYKIAIGGEIKCANIPYFDFPSQWEIHKGGNFVRLTGGCNYNGGTDEKQYIISLPNMAVIDVTGKLNCDAENSQS